MHFSAKQVSLVAAVILLGILLYWPALDGGYVWDDFPLFVVNPDLRTGDVRWEHLARPVLERTTYFRPTVLLSFVLEFRAWGASAGVSHAINVGIYACNVGLIFVLARALFVGMGLGGAGGRAALAAVLYSVHPALTESVAWISGRFDLLVTTFVLCALVSDLLLANRWARAFALFTFFLLALGSKEAAVSLPPLLMLQRLLYERQEREGLLRCVFRVLQNEWLTVVALAIAFGGYLYVRMDAMGALLHSGDVKLAESLVGHTLLVFNTLAFYMREIALPFSTTSPLHEYEAEDLLSWTGHITALAAAAAVVAAAFFAAKKKPTGLIAIAVLVALLPVLNLVPLTIQKSIGHDRFLTLPLAFFSIGVAQLGWLNIDWFRRRAQVLAVTLVGGIWILLAAATVRVTVPIWASDVALWTWTYQRHPDAAVARSHLLSAALTSQRYELAKPIFERMLREGALDPLDQLLYADYLTGIGNTGAAKAYASAVLETAPRFHEDGGAEARAMVKNAGMSFPLAHGYHVLAKAQAADGEYVSALQNVRAALWYQPRIPSVMLLQSNILLALNLVAESDAVLRETRLVAFSGDGPILDNERARFVATACKKNPGLDMCLSSERSTTR